MCARGGDLEPVPGHQFQDLSPQSHELGARLRRRVADLGPDFDNRLVQLRLYLREHQVVAAQDFRDVRLQFAGLGIDDLVLFLDAEREGWGLHRASTRNVGVCDPPPAVTLTRAAVDRRDMHPSTCVPWYAYGAVSKMRSARITRPSTTLGNGSLGIGTRSCTTNGSVSAVRTAASHVAPSTSHPSTIPAPPYASFGLSTRRSRCSIMKGTRSTVRPSRRVLRSATTRVQGMWASIASRSSSENSPTLRSSLNTARLAFLWSSLQRNGLTMHTAPVSTARTTGWSRPPRSTSPLMRTRL